MNSNSDSYGLRRSEKKYVISGDDKDILVARLSRILERDSHAGADGIYTVRSLYFDSSTGNDNAKFRIRFYSGNDSFLRLEKKLRASDGSRKECTVITKDECRLLITGDTSFISQSSSALLREFSECCVHSGLKPASIVEYSRSAFVYPPSQVRITVDFDLRSCPASEDFFVPVLTAAVPVYHDGSCLAEVKYSGFLPDFILEIIDLAAKRDTGFSKYL